MTKVSVVIPSFNSQATIAEAINSVLEQTHADIEVIFIDDGSTDQTVEILNSITDPRFQWTSQIHKGCAAARNHGVALATSDLLCFLDADDIWVKDKLERQIVDIKSAKMVFSHVQEFIDPSVRYHAPPRVMPGYYASTIMILRSDFLQVGLFNETLDVAEFIDWFSRAKDSGLSTYLDPEILAFRRIHQGNVGRLNKPNSHHYAIALKATIDRKRKQVK